MNRNDFLRKFVAKEQLGLEIAPWFRPVVPKSEGYNSLTLDIFDRDTLVEKARAADLAYMADRIQAVDFIGNAIDVDEVVRKKYPAPSFHYILSSHNFEHIPNPIKFLRACSQIMVDGGYLSMAIPDKRYSFDYFRPISTTADFLSAFFENRTRPTLAQIYTHKSLASYYLEGGTFAYGFSAEKNPGLVQYMGKLGDIFEAWKQASLREPALEYTDVHCSVFTPSSFELIILDIAKLDLIDLQIVEISPTKGLEFIVHLQKRNALMEEAEFIMKRNELLHKINDECASNAKSVWSLRQALQHSLNTLNPLMQGLE